MAAPLVHFGPTARLDSVNIASQQQDTAPTSLVIGVMGHPGDHRAPMRRSSSKSRCRQ
ncbi:hypothetical protein I553_5667 [Mycobacterium xenopi 4042]|uniref:Uncharacterized protein n=1 Tax=Mycobacterium xenopi 4042 TaxID=1299334 RepID=X7ZWC7_MYCXE|nr:hypothetical protein I553_5667 [Mycobacterium xenopi 4042]